MNMACFLCYLSHEKMGLVILVRDANIALVAMPRRPHSAQHIAF